MKFLDWEFNLGSDDAVEVRLDKQANVRMLDEPNYERFLRRQKHRFYGGWAIASPVVLRPPYAGHWHVIVDRGGYGGTVYASACVI